MYQLRGMASTLRMRHTISTGQWQPWTAISPLGLTSMASRQINERGLTRLSVILHIRGGCKHSFKRQLHRKQVVTVGWELQNSSPTACVWR